MIDILRIHVLFDPASREGERLAELISAHFDGLGMDRDGIAYRIVVRLRSEPWSEEGGPPGAIEVGDALHNAVILIYDDAMRNRGAVWEAYVASTKAGLRTCDAYIPFADPTRDGTLHCDAGIHYGRRAAWERELATPAARDTRLLIHVLHGIRSLLRRQVAPEPRAPLFVSHAKLDGDATAQTIVDYLGSTALDVTLDTFYDGKTLAPGDDFRRQFVDEIGRGTLLALVSDAYDGRPWCLFELITAKRARRPIVLGDLGTRSGRTFPYGGNLPRVRIREERTAADWIEPLLVEILSEGLRCDLVSMQGDRIAEAAAFADYIVLPRPPELLDVVDRDPLAAKILYPDPPLGHLEEGILRKGLALRDPTAVVLTFSEALPA